MAMAASREVGGLVARHLRLDELLSLAKRYRIGGVAGQAAPGWMATDLDAPVRYIEDNRDRFGAEGTALADFSDTTLAALCLLESEVAFQGGDDAAERLRYARRLLNAANRAQLPSRFAERWYVAVAGYLQGYFRTAEALGHVEDGVGRFPNDAAILVTAGIFYELVASPSYQLPPPDMQKPAYTQNRPGERVSGLNLSTPNDDYERLRAAKKIGLGRAEELYRKALGLDPRNAEAHLRLGRVLFLTSRSDAALSEIRLAASDPAPRVQYLASMFEAAVHERASHWDTALACYEKAVRACPNCLSGGIALSWSQRRTGRPDLAVQTLDAATARRTFSDYWWDYPLGEFWRHDQVIAQLRGDVQ